MFSKSHIERCGFFVSGKQDQVDGYLLNNSRQQTFNNRLIFLVFLIFGHLINDLNKPYYYEKNKK